MLSIGTEFYCMCRYIVQYILQKYFQLMKDIRQIKAKIM